MNQRMFGLVLGLAVVAGYAGGVGLRTPKLTTGTPSATSLAPTAAGPDESAPRVPSSPLFNPGAMWLHGLAGANASELALHFFDLLDERTSPSHSAATFDGKFIPLIERWAEVAPLAAARHIAESGVSHRLPEFFAVWARVDPDAAASAVAQWEPPSARPPLRAILLEAMAERDPERFLARLAAGSPERAEITLTPAVDAALDSLIDRDPDAAKALLDTLPRRNRRDLIQKIAEAAATTDPASVIAWAETLPQARERDEAMAPAAIALAKTDLAAATALAPRFSHHRFPTSEIARWLARSDPKAAFAWIAESVPAGSARDRARHELIAPILRSDPALAAHFIRDICADKDSHHFASTGFAGLRENDYAPVAETLEPEFDRPGSRLAMAGLVDAWASRHPTTAVDWLLSRQRLFDSIFRESAPELPRSILEKATRDDGARDRLLAEILKLPAGRKEQILEPLAAVEDSRAPDPIDPFKGDGRGQSALLESPLLRDVNRLAADDRMLVTGGVAAEMARRDPAEAVRWIGTITDPPAREAAIRGAAAAWVDYEPEAASRWALSLAPGRERDTAAARLAEALQQTDPESAWAWHVSISTRELRSDSARRLVSRITPQTIDLTAALIRESAIPDAERADLLRSLDRQQRR